MSSKVFPQLLNELAQDTCSLLDPTLVKSDYIALDLSKDNSKLLQIDLSSSDELEIFIHSYVKKNKAKVAFGGYLETRNIYRRSTHFNNFKPVNERNIHLGLDLWIDAGTPIYAPLDAKIHSFKNNTLLGDYGPTIVLEHHIQNCKFYTLYGHLSLESIENLTIGDQFKKGSQLATLGAASVNGDYPPHLHFQIIKDIQDYVGDYPGVCSKQDLEFYKNNCPDPNLLLKL